ncbi:hypothetical protein OG365_39670 (plasmid) [Streptomyces sp. NBC_00853]|nr:hypothetical protein OG365_39670 [Streptomyces sp. NBC_00853]
MIPSPAASVREFHEKCSLPIQRCPADISEELSTHRQRLLNEEVAELSEAAESGHLDHVARELADVVYIAYGTALTYGIDLDLVLAEIHQSNLTKLGPDGRPELRADGKVLKGRSFVAPDVRAVLRGQGWTPGSK